jgi:hypothetical protein
VLFHREIGRLDPGCPKGDAVGVSLDPQSRRRAQARRTGDKPRFGNQRLPFPVGVVTRIGHARQQAFHDIFVGGEPDAAVGPAGAGGE